MMMFSDAPLFCPFNLPAVLTSVRGSAARASKRLPELRLRLLSYSILAGIRSLKFDLSGGISTVIYNAYLT
jgi:hypothetical protein